MLGLKLNLVSRRDPGSHVMNLDGLFSSFFQDDHDDHVNKQFKSGQEADLF